MTDQGSWTRGPRDSAFVDPQKVGPGNLVNPQRISDNGPTASSSSTRGTVSGLATHLHLHKLSEGSTTLILILQLKILSLREAR